jgi:hypothetical protein
MVKRHEDALAGIHKGASGEVNFDDDSVREVGGKVLENWGRELENWTGTDIMHFEARLNG